MRHVLAIALLATFVATTAATAATGSILVDDTRVFPESMTSTPNSTVIVSSVGGTGAGRIFRALPGQATAEPWISLGHKSYAGGLRRARRRQIQHIVGVFR